MTFFGLLEEYLREGTLAVQLPDGSHRSFGSGHPEASIRINEAAAVRRIAYDPAFEFGQTYMEGGWDPGEQGLRPLLDVTMSNFRAFFAQQGRRPLAFLQKILQQGNRIRRAYQNVSHHYDLDEWLFRRFLDKGMFYSCAYFARAGMTIEEAQVAKCRQIALKLCLKPGMRVLDIGSGWGGLAMHLASEHGALVDGLTLSREQLRVAQEECHDRGLDDRVTFLLRDYREHIGQYDRIVSVGMFEHVGQPYYRAFFRQLNDLLSDDGIALLHTIGRTSPPGTTNAWLRRYIFPGGYTPALSELSSAIEPTGLITTDLEVWRLHYAETLAEWYRRFQSVRAEVAQRFDERFCRMWEFYLASCEGTFRHWDQVVFHVQIAKHHNAVPITRDYLCPAEVGGSENGEESP